MGHGDRILLRGIDRSLPCQSDKTAAALPLIDQDVALHQATLPSEYQTRQLALFTLFLFACPRQLFEQLPTRLHNAVSLNI